MVPPSKPVSPQVSIVVPTWNAPQDVERMLPSILAQEGPSFEVVVVDNGVVNTDTKDVVARFQANHPELRYLSFEKQLGYAGAVNEGAKAARSSIVAIMNNDNTAESGWLEALYSAYRSGRERSRKKTAIVSARIARPGIAHPLRGGMNLLARTVFDDDAIAPSKPFPVFHPDGSSFLFNRDLLGVPYEDEYFVYHEDVALGWRAWLMGYEVLCAPQAKGATFDGGSTRRMPYRTVLFTERNRWFNRIAFSSLKSLLVFSPIWALDSLLSALLGRNMKAKVNAWFEVFRQREYLCDYRKRMQDLRREKDERIFENLISDGNLLSRLAAAYASIFGYRVLSLREKFKSFSN